MTDLHPVTSLIPVSFRFRAEIPNELLKFVGFVFSAAAGEAA